MTHLAACILALSVLRIAPSGPVYARQLRTEGAHERAVYLAERTHDAARHHGVSPVLLGALVWLEAALDRDRVSPVGCVGITQVCGRMKSAYLKACALLHPWECDALALSLAARELSQGFRVCGTERGAVSFYRFGHCLGSQTWRVRQVIALRDELEWSAP